MFMFEFEFMLHCLSDTIIDALSVSSLPQNVHTHAKRNECHICAVKQDCTDDDNGVNYSIIQYNHLHMG